MNKWKKPPVVLTLKKISEEMGVPYGTVLSRYYARGRKFNKLKDKLKRGKKLKRLNGMTQAEAARALGVSRQRVNEMVKKGRRLDSNNHWL